MSWNLLRALVKLVFQMLLFYQDNVPAHSASVTAKILRECGYEVALHKPYSHDLVSGNISFFPESKSGSIENNSLFALSYRYYLKPLILKMMVLSVIIRSTNDFCFFNVFFFYFSSEITPTQFHIRFQPSATAVRNWWIPTTLKLLEDTLPLNRISRQQGSESMRTYIHTYI